MQRGSSHFVFEFVCHFHSVALYFIAIGSDVILFLPCRIEVGREGNLIVFHRPLASLRQFIVGLLVARDDIHLDESAVGLEPHIDSAFGGIKVFGFGHLKWITYPEPTIDVASSISSSSLPQDTSARLERSMTKRMMFFGIQSMM